jgi:hypothetical protein
MLINFTEQHYFYFEKIAHGSTLSVMNIKRCGYVLMPLTGTGRPVLMES